MNKFLTLTAAFALMLNLSISAQNQPNKKKPGFTLDEKTMTELGFSPEQKQKIQESKVAFNTEIKKIQAEGIELMKSLDKSEDSVLTAPQQQKVETMREALREKYKTNLSQMQPIKFDQKTMDELELSAEQRQKITKLYAVNHIQRWNNAQKMQKLFKDTVINQEAVFTVAQKQKADEMKTAIIEYNKTVQ